MAPTDRARAGFGPISPRAALVIVAAVVIGVVLYQGRSALGPFVLGLVFAYLLDIPVGTDVADRPSPWLSLLIVYAIVVVVVVQAALLTVPAPRRRALTFIPSSRRSRPRSRTCTPTSTWRRPFATRSTRGSPISAPASAGSIRAPLPVVSGIAGVVGSIVGYVLIPVWIFYLIKDRPALGGRRQCSAPERAVARYRRDRRARRPRVFGQWVRGQVFLGVTVGVMTFLGLLLLSQTVDPIFGRFAILLSVVAGVLELLPIIGPILAAIPAVLLALTAGLDVGIAAVILYTAIQQLENYLLVPKIQGDAVQLHPSAVMFALIVGGAIAGLLGAILALPITAAARDVFRYVFHRVDEQPATPAEAVARSPSRSSSGRCRIPRPAGTVRTQATRPSRRRPTLRPIKRWTPSPRRHPCRGAIHARGAIQPAAPSGPAADDEPRPA